MEQQSDQPAPEASEVQRSLTLSLIEAAAAYKAIEVVVPDVYEGIKSATMAGIEKELEETYETSFSVKVPGGELELVTLTWKKIWQLGYVKMQVDRAPVEVPFKELVGVSFDSKSNMV